MDPRRRIQTLFGTATPIVGMVHLLPLPGAPQWGGSLSAVLERARADAQALVEGGVDGIMVENFGDVPFYPGAVPPETIAGLTRAILEVERVVRPSRTPIGLNVLRNDARAGVGIASATGASFLRVNIHTGSMFTDQGLLEGRAHETLRARTLLAPDLLLFADVHVKHAVPPAGGSLETAARDAVERGLADGLIVSGSGTGQPTDPERIRRVREAAPQVPVWVGSGVTVDSAAAWLGSVAEGAIVGTALHRDGIPGRGIDPERVRALVERVRAISAGDAPPPPHDDAHRGSAPTASARSTTP
jgi:uncharacterized protein